MYMRNGLTLKILMVSLTAPHLRLIVPEAGFMVTTLKGPPVDGSILDCFALSSFLLTIRTDDPGAYSSGILPLFSLKLYCFFALVLTAVICPQFSATRKVKSMSLPKASYAGNSLSWFGWWIGFAMRGPGVYYRSRSPSPFPLFVSS